MSDYIYLSSKDLYLGTDGNFYSDTEIDEFDKMEREWKEALYRDMPRSITQWLKVFPEATRPARKALKQKLKFYGQEILEINLQQEQYYDLRIAPAHFSEQEELKLESDKEFDLRRKEVERKIRSTQFELSYINELEGKGVAKTTNGVTEGDILKAKEVPLESVFHGKLHKHGRLAVGPCPFHKEKTGSFTIYLDQNSWWCYGCQNGGSVVDFVMQQNDVDFLTAVKQLLK